MKTMTILTKELAEKMAVSIALNWLEDANAAIAEGKSPAKMSAYEPQSLIDTFLGARFGELPLSPRQMARLKNLAKTQAVQFLGISDYAPVREHFTTQAEEKPEKVSYYRGMTKYNYKGRTIVVERKTVWNRWRKISEHDSVTRIDGTIIMGNGVRRATKLIDAGRA